MLFNPETGVAILPIECTSLAMLPRSREHCGKVLTLKSEFHITIIGSQLARKLLARLGETEYRVQLDEIASQIDWHWRLESLFYHVVKPKTRSLSDGSTEIIHAESIIQMATVDGIDDFYDRLSIIAVERLIPPPTHVTLYVYGDLQGIGIADRQDLMKYTSILPNISGR